MIIDRRIIAGLLAATALTGCASVADKEFVGYQDPGFGEANRATYAAMVVNPDPKYDKPIPASSAEHAAQAIERYRTDAVKRPERVETTDIGGGG
ncbi:hypothetical protein [Altererythrobacter lutimaris]|uniref:Uncharacterized protein n=1 Tax=Altererythrobacter lutimaris TaxID=2743979 RepID=A0A850HC42_9SPHN|nr:hypothetical protein [Altererythrobacter lutimaris]NVE94178.1 hypothetical protein [Altererythrobacter lutimaris]